MSTISSYTGDGATAQFDITWPYDTTDQVNVEVDGVAAPFSFVNSSRVQLDNVPVNGAAVRIFRRTNVTNPAVDFSDGAIIRADDLDAGMNQVRFRTQELGDLTDDVYGRAILAPAGETPKPLLSAAKRAGKFAVWDADGNPDVADGAVTLPAIASNISFTPPGVGSVVRDVDARLKEKVSVLDYGADPTGVADSTNAFKAAEAAAMGGEIVIPLGRYLLGNVGGLGAAGTRWRGVSKYGVILQASTGLTGAIFYNPNSGVGSSSFCSVSGVRFDLNGEDIIAVDLSSVDSSVVQDFVVEGGVALDVTTTDAVAVIAGLTSTSRIRAGQNVYGANVPAGATVASVDGPDQITLSSPATATGETTLFFVAGQAVKFAAPLAKGAYDNVVLNGAGQYLNIGVEFGQGANSEAVFGSRWLGCNYGYYAYNATTNPDTPRVIGGRVEACNVGVLEGSGNGSYELRFENSHTADIEWTANSNDATFEKGCLTAASATINKNLNLATSPHILSHDLGVYDLEASTSRPKLFSGRTTVAPAGVTPAASTAASDYALHLQGYQLLSYTASIEFENYNGGSPNNRVLAMNIDNSGRVSFPGYDRATGSYHQQFFGPEISIMPGQGILYSGTKVLGARQLAVGAATDAAGATPTQAEFNALVAKFNDLVAKLGASGHGLTAD